MKWKRVSGSPEEVLDMIREAFPERYADADPGTFTLFVLDLTDSDVVNPDTAAALRALHDLRDMFPDRRCYPRQWEALQAAIQALS